MHLFSYKIARHTRGEDQSYRDQIDTLTGLRVLPPGDTILALVHEPLPVLFLFLYRETRYDLCEPP